MKKDLLHALAISFLVPIFAIPFLVNTNLLDKIPFVSLFLFIAFPIATLVGMAIAEVIGKKLPILLQVARFALVGVLNTIMDFGILNFLILLTGITGGLGIILMNATSFSTSIVNSYFWNKEWVFPTRKGASFITFFLVTLVGLGVNTAIVFIMTTFMSPAFGVSPGLWANIAKALATGVSLFWNFAGYKIIVFKQ